MSQLQPANRREFSLLQCIANGETSAYGDLVNSCRREVFTAALCRTRNLSDAEDVVQEAIVKAWAALGGFQMRSKFSTWLVQIAINEARMRFRREAKCRHVPVEANFGTGKRVPRELIEWRNIPSEEFERKQIRIALTRAFLSLPHKYREVFVLRDIEGLNTMQAAKMLNINKDTVKTRLLRARRRMRTEMISLGIR